MNYTNLQSYYAKLQSRNVHKFDLTALNLNLPEKQVRATYLASFVWLCPNVTMQWWLWYLICFSISFEIFYFISSKFHINIIILSLFSLITHFPLQHPPILKSDEIILDHKILILQTENSNSSFARMHVLYYNFQ